MRYVDTSFWVALFRAREKHHLTAALIWESNREPLLTTVSVLGETWTFMRRRETHAAALAVRDAIQSSELVTVVETDAAIHAAAWKWLHRRDEHEYSFVDAVSFEVMRRRRIREALAFDGDFTRAGYVEVR
jgi:predicted nucleic acid-binding protein